MLKWREISNPTGHKFVRELSGGQRNVREEYSAVVQAVLIESQRAGSFSDCSINRFTQIIDHFSIQNHWFSLKAEFPAPKNGMNF